MNEPNKLVLHNTGLERLASGKYSSLRDPIVSYDENVVLWIRSLVIIKMKWKNGLMFIVYLFV